MVPGERFCPSGTFIFVRDVCRSRLWVGDLAIGGMSIGAIAFSYLARGTSQTPGCLLFVVGASGAAGHCFLCWFPLLCVAVRGIPYLP